MSAPIPKPLKVLLPIHQKVDALDFVGPLAILGQAHFPAPTGPPFAPRDTSPSPATKAFKCTVTASEPFTNADQGVAFSRDIDFAEAYQRLSEFDVLVIPGGGSQLVLENKSEPLGLIRAFAALPKREDGRIRVLLSVCTGSLFLASQGVLKGLTAGTHPSYSDKLKVLCREQGDGVNATKVVDERYIVNPVGENGLRVVTSGGNSCGLDGSLWLVEEVAGPIAREEVCYITQYDWRKGMIVGE